MEDTPTPDGQLRAAARNLTHAIPLDTDATRRAVAALCDRVTSEQHLLRLREIQDAHRVVNRLRNWQRDAEIRGRHLRLHLCLGKLLADFVVNPHPWVRPTVAVAAIQAFPEHLMEGVCIPHHPVPGTGASAIVFARQAIHYAFLFGHDESDIIGSLETPSQDVARYRYVTGSPLEDERFDHLTGDARDLEAAVFVRLLDPVSEFLQSLGQLRPVDGADRHLLAVEAVVHHGAPLAVPALDHVGDHAVRVELGIEVARGVVAEGCRHHLLPAGANHGSRRLVLHPGPDGVPLNPGEGLAHRLVVRLDDPLVAA